MKIVIDIPNNPTNGDVFLKTFPNSKIVSVSNIMVTVFVSNMYLSIEFDKDWWNAPYKEEGEIEDESKTESKKSEKENKHS